MGPSGSTGLALSAGSITVPGGGSWALDTNGRDFSSMSGDGALWCVKAAVAACVTLTLGFFSEMRVLSEADEEGVRCLHPVLLRALLHLLPRHLRTRSWCPHGAGRLALCRVHHLLQTQSG